MIRSHVHQRNSPNINTVYPSDENHELPISVSFHFKERMVTRIHKIANLNEKQIRDHVTYNNLALTQEALAMFDNAEFLWQGVVAPQFPQANFYVYFHEKLHEHFMIVTDSSRKTMITVYQIEFALPAVIANNLKRQLLTQARKLRTRIKQIAERRSPVFEKRDQQIKRLEGQIGKLEVELQKKKARLESQKQKRSKESLPLEYLRGELAEIVKWLANSKFLGQDFQDWKQNTMR